MDRIATDCNGRKYITNESSQDKRIAELEAKLAIADKALEHYAQWGGDIAAKVLIQIRSE